MNDKDYIKELFSEKLSNHEAPVNPKLWEGIQSQLGNTAATSAAKGISAAAKWAVGIASSVVVAGAAVVWLASDSRTQQNKLISKTEQTVRPENDQTEKETQTGREKSLSGTEKQPQETGSSEANTSNGSPQDMAPVPNAAPLILKERAPEQENTKDPVNKGIEKSLGEKAPAGIENPIGVSSPSGQQTTRPEGKIGILPDVFTPNGDRTNDVLTIEMENIVEFQMTVMDEKNKVVFTTDKPEWDGIDNYGNKVPEGNYFYYIMAVDKNNQRINKYSKLRIIINN